LNPPSSAAIESAMTTDWLGSTPAFRERIRGRALRRFRVRPGSARNGQSPVLSNRRSNDSYAPLEAVRNLTRPAECAGSGALKAVYGTPSVELDNAALSLIALRRSSATGRSTSTASLPATNSFSGRSISAMLTNARPNFAGSPCWVPS
jgi:hypothetical protein